MSKINTITREVTEYQTTDGSYFDSYTEATFHQKCLDAPKIYIVHVYGALHVFSTEELAKQHASTYQNEPTIQELSVDIYVKDNK